MTRRRLQSLVWYPGLTRAKGPVLIYVEGGGGGGEGSAFVSFKTQGQLIPDCISLPISFCERPANVLDQIVQVLSSGAGLVMSKGFLGSPLIRLVYFVTTM